MGSGGRGRKKTKRDISKRVTGVKVEEKRKKINTRIDGLEG